MDKEFSLVLAPMGAGKTRASKRFSQYGVWDSDQAQHGFLKERLKDLRRSGNWNEHNKTAFAAIWGALNLMAAERRLPSFVLDHTGYFLLHPVASGDTRQRLRMVEHIFLLLPPEQVAVDRVRARSPNDPRAQEIAEGLCRQNYRSLVTAIDKFVHYGRSFTVLDSVIPFYVHDDGSGLITNEACNAESNAVVTQLARLRRPEGRKP